MLVKLVGLFGSINRHLIPLRSAIGTTNSLLNNSSTINNNKNTPNQQQQTRFATKKAGGSSGNGRDSIGRRLGIKIFPGMLCRPGNIIIRQRGMKFLAGDGVGVGKDHTIFAKEWGVVKFEKVPFGRRKKRKKMKNVVNVLESGMTPRMRDIMESS